MYYYCIPRVLHQFDFEIYGNLHKNVFIFKIEDQTGSTKNYTHGQLNQVFKWRSSIKSDTK
jgi:hypothetical protein